jgi:hypothetical protein
MAYAECLKARSGWAIWKKCQAGIANSGAAHMLHSGHGLRLFNVPRLQFWIGRIATNQSGCKLVMLGETARAKFCRMRRVRNNRQFGGWLALFALAVQLVLSFGHVHLEGIRGDDGTGTKLAAERAVSPPAPAQHPANDSGDYCAICATIHLASSSFLPDAPQLPVPFVSQAIEHFYYVPYVFAAPQRTAFQSRAPPLA